MVWSTCQCSCIRTIEQNKSRSCRKEAINFNLFFCLLRYKEYPSVISHLVTGQNNFIQLYSIKVSSKAAQYYTTLDLCPVAHMFLSIHTREKVTLSKYVEYKYENTANYMFLQDTIVHTPKTNNKRKAEQAVNAVRSVQELQKPKVNVITWEV